MHPFKRGTYIGALTKLITDKQFIISLTTYEGKALQQPLHCHDNLHISLVLRGGSLEKRKNKEIERLPGKITFYYPGEYHQSINSINFSKHINLELEQQFLQEHQIKESSLSDAVAAKPDAKFILLRMYREMIIGDCLSSESIHMLLLDLVHISLKQKPGTHKPSWLSIIEESFRNEPERDISLRRLSNLVNVHPVTVSKQFHNYYGCTLGEFVRKLKVEKAIRLIKSSHTALTDIAYECGFADQSHFTRTFKTSTGMMPKEWRKT